MSADIRILDDLSAVPEASQCAILIRHGNRDGSLDKLQSDSVDLNQTGVERARRLGEEIVPRPLAKLYSSPAKRCLRTCECITEGHGMDATVVPSRFLGMEGPFIYRPKEAAELMTAHGFVSFVEDYVAERTDGRVLMPCPEVAAMIIGWTACRMRSGPRGLSVIVTHDLVLTPFMVRTFGYDVRGKGLVTFLDGFVVYERGSSLIARHDGKEVDVTSLASKAYD